MIPLKLCSKNVFSLSFDNLAANLDLKYCILLWKQEEIRDSKDGIKVSRRNPVERGRIFRTPSACTPKEILTTNS